MTIEERIFLLERALASYIEKYGFTEEARQYFIEHYMNAHHRTDLFEDQKHPH